MGYSHISFDQCQTLNIPAIYLSDQVTTIRVIMSWSCSSLAANPYGALLTVSVRKSKVTPPYRLCDEKQQENINIVTVSGNYTLLSDSVMSVDKTTHAVIFH